MGLAASKRLQSEDPEVANAFDLYPNGKHCFSCGAILRDAADEHSVYWHGAGITIFFHNTCAISIGGQLIKDGLIAAQPDSMIPRELPWEKTQ